MTPFGGSNASHNASGTSLNSLLIDTALLVERSSARMRYHVFISHMQVEASGDVGTIFHELGPLGVFVALQACQLAA
ncbi:MAG: hypothetical protein ACPGR3_03195, partial [Ilumatobacteraceae bacterium]